jgi:hypothetical protein
MRSRPPPSTWLPDRPPTWADLLVTGFVVWLGVEGPPLRTVAWPLVAVGFVSTAVLLGPIANSSFGTRVGQWFEAVGTWVRTFLLSSFAVGVWIIEWVADVPVVPIRIVVTGSMVMHVVYFLVLVL